MIAYASFWKAGPKKPRLLTPAGARAAYALANAHHPQFKKAYRAAIESIATPDLVNKLARAIRNKSLIAIDGVLPVFNPVNPEDAARWDAAYQTMEDRYRALLKKSGKQALASVGIHTSFSLDNPYSMPWIENRAGALIKDISQQTRQNIRGLLAQSFTDGIPVNTLKGLVKAHIGLLPREAQSVERRYNAAVAQGVKPAIATDNVARFADKLLDQRAERIARTETIAAEAQGSLDAWRTAHDDGLLVDGTRREWISSTEANGSCRWCAMLDGIKVGLHDAFMTHYGAAMGPPLHPQCRCSVALVPPGES